MHSKVVSAALDEYLEDAKRARRQGGTAWSRGQGIATLKHRVVNQLNAQDGGGPQRPGTARSGWSQRSQVTQRSQLTSQRSESWLTRRSSRVGRAPKPAMDTDSWATTRTPIATTRLTYRTSRPGSAPSTASRRGTTRGSWRRSETRTASTTRQQRGVPHQQAAPDASFAGLNEWEILAAYQVRPGRWGWWACGELCTHKATSSSGRKAK